MEKTNKYQIFNCIMNKNIVYRLNNISIQKNIYKDTIGLFVNVRPCSWTLDLELQLIFFGPNLVQMGRVGSGRVGSGPVIKDPAIRYNGILYHSHDGTLWSTHQFLSHHLGHLLCWLTILCSNQSKVNANT